MKKINYSLFIFAFLFCLLESCQKNTTDPPPVIPPDTTVTFLPSHIEYLTPYPEENVTADFVYSTTERTVKVNLDHPQTAYSYKYVNYIIFYYTKTGYLEKREAYLSDGTLDERFIPERDNANILKRVLIEQNGIPLKDTFNISFIDSVASYKRMRINNISRTVSGSAIPTFNDFTFFNDQLIKMEGGIFSDDMSELMLPNLKQSYDAAGRLVSEEAIDDSFGTSLSYETTGTGLDSLCRFLGGIDGHFLTTFYAWPTFHHSDFYFEPLDLELHEFGALKKMLFMPDNIEYNYQNTFDSNQRITESSITSNGTYTAQYKIAY